MRLPSLICILLLLTPVICLAATGEPDGEQQSLGIQKFVEIVGPGRAAVLLLLPTLVTFLTTVLSARIFFKPENVWIQTIIWWVVFFISWVGILIVAGILTLALCNVGLILGVLLAIIAPFFITMRVFDASFLRALVFLVVLLITITVESVVLPFASLLLVRDKIGQLARLDKDVKNGSIRADKDYSKPSGIETLERENTEEETLAPTAARPMTFQEQAASLNARFAALKERFAKLDKTNAAEVTQYNADYKKYTEELNAYNLRVKTPVPLPAAP